MSIQGMQGRPDPAEKFKALDVDKNGELSKTEMDTMMKETMANSGGS